jgi:hypothetical protein
MDKHSELELKYEACHVTEMAFQLWCVQHHPVAYQATSFPDHYYRRGTSVVRHRMSGGAGELTTKQRKSEDSVTDRIEIDLKFSHDTTENDVKAFIKATGWQHEVSLHKHFSHVYWFKHAAAKLALSLYEVEEVPAGRISRMLEIEIEKDSNITDVEANALLKMWSSVLTEDFDLGMPLDRSLYEIYTGKRYEMATSNRPALDAAFAIR